ncbi:uncharacterized protein LOC127784750 [Oryza glaberrima]|uniref:uncharacterized protein LOC127784750 n=1 Tax=Oryza glaberrima TaxID=4538 RepID=UPI00224C454D|nr:uncharacterized protein LOC127784750 [Oryza glaberrima]
MGLSKPKIVDFAPLIDRVEGRLSSLTTFLNYGQILTMVNSILSSLPTYYMSTIKLPKKVIMHIDRARRHCLWRKTAEVSAKTHSLAAWDMVCKPKNKGGLGIINLEFQNCALLLKHLDKFFNKQDIPGVKLIWTNYYPDASLPPHACKEMGSFWWKDIIRLIPLFRAIAQITPHGEDSALFWKDDWHGTDPCFAEQFKVLFSYAAKEDISIFGFMNDQNLTNQFYLPISPQALQEWNTLQNLIAHVSLNNEDDHWGYKWSHPGFQSKQVYSLFYDHLSVDLPLTFIWKSKCTLKLKVFLYGF